MSSTTPTVDAHGERVQGMFDRIAHGYDRANRLMSMGIDVRWRNEAVRGLLPETMPANPDGSRRAAVLDLCAGTMDSSVEIHRQYPQADIVAGDFAEEMLAKGAHKLTGAVGERITPQPMDAHDLPFDDDSLDAIFCAFGVRNVSDLPRATAEQARTLRPGGRLTILEFFRPTSGLSRLLHTAYNRTVLPVVGWAATGDLDAYTYLPKSIGKFEAVQDYEALLGEHGFVNVSHTKLTMGMAWIVRAEVPR
ncbi:MAG: ubiquinone/menaquinone biosynthesis methyltransferase [Nannocystaceae bacterium]|nr:ubiquinone/menaquinone biosynthesis methyltransferase [bacterium]